ncbi:MAG: membrane protein insertase YidC [Thermoanaerobaculum sp.]
MERRALLAVVLSVVAIVAWYSLFPPAPPARLDKGVAPAAQGEKGVDAPAAAEAQGGGEAVSGEREEEVVLEGEGFTAVVSNRGGVVRSLKLGKYRDSNGQPQELAGEGGEILAVVPDGPWNRELFRLERVPGGVSLVWADGRGRRVEKRLKVAGPYRLEVEGTLWGFGPEAGVVASGRLATWPGGEGTNRLARADFVLRVGGKLKRVAAGKAESEGATVAPDFVGAEDQYFVLAFLPKLAAGAKVDGGRALVVVGSSGRFAGLLVGAPKEHRLLRELGRGLDETLSFGFFGFLSLLFLEVLRWIHSWSGNWGVGIILLTALIRVLLFPLTHKSTVAMRGMAKLQPKIKAIQERYQERAKKDPAVRQKMNEEIMALYRREGVNPMGGCLPMVVQIPILWALYTLFAFAIELRHQPFFLWIRDLSAKDPTYVTPILMTASMVLQQRLAPQTGDPAQRRMFMLLPFVFGLMFMNFPSGLVLYWLVNNLLTIAQQLLTERLLRRADTTA